MESAGADRQAVRASHGRPTLGNFAGECCQFGCRRRPLREDDGMLWSDPALAAQQRFRFEEQGESISAEPL